MRESRFSINARSLLSGLKEKSTIQMGYECGNFYLKDRLFVVEIYSIKKVKLMNHMIPLRTENERINENTQI